MSRLRLFVDSPLQPGAAVQLTPAQAHYLGTVMRRGPGDGLLLFNGRHGEWRAEISDLKRRRRGTDQSAVRFVSRTGDHSRWPSEMRAVTPAARAATT